MLSIQANNRRSELAAEWVTHFAAMIRGMDSIFRKDMEAQDVTWPQFGMMKLIERNGPMTVTDISNSMLVAPPTASRMIEGLRSKGLLAKEKDSSDHRLTRIALTPASRQLVSRLRKLQNEVMLEVFEGEETADLEESVRSLGRFAEKTREAARAKARKGIEDE